MSSSALAKGAESGGLSLDSVIRKLGILVLVFLPFQGFPKTLQMNKYLSGINPKFIELISYADEVSFIIFSFLTFTFIVLRPDLYRISKVPFTKWIAGFIFFALFSMAINKVPVAQGAFGIYDVLKNIIVIYPFAMLRYDEKDLLKALRLLLYAVLLLAIVGVFAEVFAVLFKKGFDLFVLSQQRYGLYRVISLAGYGNWNYLGVFATLIFYLHYIKENRQMGNKFNLALIGFLVIFSFSRQVWLGFILMYFLLSGKTKRWAAVLASVFFIVTSSSFYENILRFVLVETSFDSEQYFRLHAFLSSLNFVAENPVTGLGPGMFGGLASVLFESPVYNAWIPFYKQFAYSIRGIDQFWPVIWAETGIAGMALYAMIFIGIFRYLRQAGEYFESVGKREVAGIGRVLRIYILPLVIMGFAGGLNSAFVLYTYFALVGMYISVYHRHKADHGYKI